MRFNKFLEKRNYLYLGIFFPITLFIGVAVGEIFSSLIIIYYIFNSNNKLSDFKDIKILFLLVFSLYLALNALLQIDGTLKYSPIFFFRFILFSISIAYIFDLLIKDDSKLKTFFLDIFFLFIVVIIIDSLIQFFFGKNLLGYEIINYRISSFLREELILGSFLVRTLPFLIFLIILFNYELTNRKRFFIFFFFILFFFNLFIS